ncbi:MAG: hypothetical protein M3R38_08295 [Actinomycetota bacterium]|nr:hypothetical protein [Actinomycetota bacterium]
MPIVPNLPERLLLTRLNRVPAPLLDVFGALAFRAVRAAPNLGLEGARGKGTPVVASCPMREEVVVTDWQSTRAWRAFLLPAVNRLMRAWLRSGWHRPVSSSMAVLTYRGTRSGRTYSFPVGYAEDAEGFITFTRFPWWKNFREERPVSLRLRGCERRGTAVAVRDPEAVTEGLGYYLGRNPHDGRFFGVRVDRNGRVSPDELARAAGRLVMIRTRPEGARKGAARGGPRTPRPG